MHLFFKSSRSKIGFLWTFLLRYPIGSMLFSDTGNSVGKTEVKRFIKIMTPSWIRGSFQTNTSHIDFIVQFQGLSSYLKYSWVSCACKFYSRRSMTSYYSRILTLRVFIQSLNYDEYAELIHLRLYHLKSLENKIDMV